MKNCCSFGLLAFVALFFTFAQVQAQPTIVSTVPANDATGISGSAAVIFTFSEPMNTDTNVTSANFYETSPSFAFFNTVSTWSQNNTVLTCTPTPAFPTGILVNWVVEGQVPTGASLSGIPIGSFTTGSGGGTTSANGTNQYTSFVIGDVYYYEQFSPSGAPAANTNLPPYTVVADVTVASNITASGASVKLPNATVTNLSPNFVAPWQFIYSTAESNETDLNAIFQNGTYTFTLVTPTSNETANVTVSSSMIQPTAPQIANFAAAQTVDATKPFTLQWNAFTGGTAKDYVFVEVAGQYESGDPGTSNALKGTATSFVIPANTLQSNQTYDAFVTFYSATVTSNKPANYITFAERASSTEFSLITTAGGGVITPPSGPMTLTNISLNGKTISFNVLSDAGQSLIVQYNTNSAIASADWHALLTTTNTSGSIQVTDSTHTSGAQVFYRAILGP